MILPSRPTSTCRALLVFGLSRIIVALVAYFAVTFLGHTMAPDTYHLRGIDSPLLDIFGSRWDTGFYVSIVEEGYRFQGVPLSSVAFFPLLPLLMRLLLPLVGDAVVAGILVANAALLLASVYFYRLVAMQWSERVAERALWYLLIFPTAFFGSAIYTESLFLLTAIGALYSARQSRWARATLFAFGAGLTRLVGIVVAPMLVLEWLRQRHLQEPGGAQSTAAVGPFAAVAAAPLGLLAFMAYLWRAFGDPLAFAHAAAAWERTPRAPGAMVAALLQRPAGGWLQALRAGTLPINDWIDLIAVLFFLAASFLLLYRRRWVEGIFVWLGVMLPLSSGLLMSQRRYMWVLFPVYILLAQWGRRRWADRTITAVFLSWQTVFIILFANGYWVG